MTVILRKHSSLSYWWGVGPYMQLCTPKLVAIAVSIAASVCKINFHVSFFIAFQNKFKVVF